MKALNCDQFGGPLRIGELPNPVPADDGVVIEVRACGVCRSDWHGWPGKNAILTDFLSAISTVGYTSGDLIELPK